MSAKRKRKVIPLETPAPENVIPFPKPKQEWTVTVESITCDDLPRRLLQVYRMLGMLGGTTVQTTNGASAGNTHAALIRDAETDSDGTA